MEIPAWENSRVPALKRCQSPDFAPENDAIEGALRNQAAPDFPSGLIQPEGCARFSADSLLLASFASRLARLPNPQALDLGCGCGVVAFAFAIHCPGAMCAGVDREECLINAARENARMLGLSGRCSFEKADVATLPDSWRKKFHMVLANPPWRDRRAGRVTPAPMRERALWSGPDTLRIFCAAAACALAPGGIFCCVLPAEKLPASLRVAAEAGLETVRILAVASFAGEAATRVLLAFAKNPKTAPRIDFPLVLHDRRGKEVAWSKEAEAFCPFLFRKSSFTATGGNLRDI